MSNSIEIKMEDGQKTGTDLESMSPDAVDAFLILVKSLKKIIESTAENDSFTLCIEKGSAIARANITSAHYVRVQDRINSAKKGTLDDKPFIDSLNAIRSTFSANGFLYNINLNEGDQSKSFKEVFLSRRKFKNADKPITYNDELTFFIGKIREVGGADPNFHVIPNGRTKGITVKCSEKEAKKVRKYLYESTYIAVTQWTPSDPDYKVIYDYVAIFKEMDILKLYRDFFYAYNLEKDEFKRLMSINEFMKTLISTDGSVDMDLVLTFMNIFIKTVKDPSALRTLLFLTKSFDSIKTIAFARKKLLKEINSKIGEIH